MTAPRTFPYSDPPLVEGEAYRWGGRFTPAVFVGHIVGVHATGLIFEDSSRTLFFVDEGSLKSLVRVDL